MQGAQFAFTARKMITALRKEPNKDAPESKKTSDWGLSLAYLLLI